MNHFIFEQNPDNPEIVNKDKINKQLSKMFLKFEKIFKTKDISGLKDPNERCYGIKLKGLNNGNLDEAIRQSEKIEKKENFTIQEKTIQKILKSNQELNNKIYKKTGKKIKSWNCGPKEASREISNKYKNNITNNRIEMVYNDQKKYDQYNKDEFFDESQDEDLKAPRNISENELLTNQYRENFKESNKINQGANNIFNNASFKYLYIANSNENTLNLKMDTDHRTNSNRVNSSAEAKENTIDKIKKKVEEDCKNLRKQIKKLKLKNQELSKAHEIKSNLNDLKNNLENLKVSQELMDNRFKSELENSGHIFQADKLIESIKEHNDKAIKNNRYEDIFVATAICKKDKNEDKTKVEVKQRQIKEEELENVKVKKTGWLGYVIGGLLIGTSIFLACSGGGAFCMALSKSLFKAGITAITENFKQNQDENYDFLNIFKKSTIDFTTTFIEEYQVKNKILNLMNKYKPKFFSDYKTFDDIYNYSMEVVDKQLNEKNVGSFLNSLMFDKENIYKEDKKIETQNHQKMRDEVKNQKKNILKSREEIEKIINDTFEEDRSKYEKALFENTEFLRNIFNYTSISCSQNNNKVQSLTYFQNLLLRNHPDKNQLLSNIDSLKNSQDLRDIDLKKFKKSVKNISKDFIKKNFIKNEDKKFPLIFNYLDKDLKENCDKIILEQNNVKVCRQFQNTHHYQDKNFMQSKYSEMNLNSQKNNQKNLQTLREDLENENIHFYIFPYNSKKMNKIKEKIIDKIYHSDKYYFEFESLRDLFCSETINYFEKFINPNTYFVNELAKTKQDFLKEIMDCHKSFLSLNVYNKIRRGKIE